MKLLITFYFNGPALGVAIYARELLSRLIPLLLDKGVLIEVVCSTDAYDYLSSNENIKNFCRIEKSLNKALNRFWYLFGLPLRQSRGVTIFHLTNPFAPPLPKFHSSRVISVIHDLNEFDERRKYGLIRSFLRRLLLSQAIKNSQSIISVSNHSRNQISNYFPRSKNVSVILNGAGSSLLQKTRKPGKSILVVGRIDPVGKNLWFTLDVLDRWHKEDPGMVVVFSGGINNSSKKDAQFFLEELDKRSFIKFLGRISDDELSNCYSTAEFLLFLSKFEGFGMPAFEALRSYCPVVAHLDNKALIELMPNELVYMDNDKNLSIKDIRSRIKKIDWTASRDVAMKFSWEKSADSYLTLLLRNDS